MRAFCFAALLALKLAITGCAGAPPQRISLDSTEFDASNAGLVVGRTLAREGGEWSGWRGLNLWLLNVDTGEIFETGDALSGYTLFEYFAIWLPEGSYQLTAIFAYNGALGPAGEPLGFTVKAGEGIYIGTVLHSWEPRRDLDKLGQLHTVSKYGRITCWICTLGAKDNTVGDRTAEVGVFDEGFAFFEGLEQKYPDLPKKITIRPRLLN